MITLTATTGPTEADDLIGQRVQITTPGGKRMQGRLASLEKRARGGWFVRWSGAEDWPSIALDGSTVEILVTEVTR